VDIQQIRNVGIIAHGGAGKTTLAEALLFNAKAVDRLGKVDDGSSNFDYDPEEIRRKITISTSFHHYTWNKVEVTLADTPGYTNFEADTRAVLRFLDGAVLVVNAVSGVEVQTEKMWSLARAADVPVIGFVSKMDKERADFDKAVAEMSEILKVHAVPVMLPIGREASFSGVIDLFRMKALVYKGDAGEFAVQDIPADMAGAAAAAREKLIEACAEADDALIEKFLEGGELSEEEIRSGFRAGVRANKFLPVLCGSSTRIVGIAPLQDLINFALPDPSYRVEVTGVNPKSKAEEKRAISEKAPFSAQVFKTLADPYAGKLSIFKIFSGTLTPEMSPLNSTKDASERIGGILRLEGKKQKAVPSASAGENVAQGDHHRRHALRPEGADHLLPSGEDGSGHLLRRPPQDAERRGQAGRVDRPDDGRGPDDPLQEGRADQRVHPRGDGGHPPRGRGREAQAAIRRRGRAAHPEDRLPRDHQGEGRGAGQAQEAGRSRSVRRRTCASVAE